MITMRGILVLNSKGYKCVRGPASTDIAFSASPGAGGAAGRARAPLHCTAPLVPSDMGVDTGVLPAVKQTTTGKRPTRSNQPFPPLYALLLAKRPRFLRLDGFVISLKWIRMFNGSELSR